MARGTRTTSGGGSRAGGTTQECVQLGSVLVTAHLVGASPRPFPDGLDLSLVESVRASGAGGRSGTTNAEGIKEFRDLPATMHTVTASLSAANSERYELLGRTRATVMVPAGGAASVNFDVAPLRVLSVRVVVIAPDSTQQPVEQVEVQLGDDRRVTTGADGVARFERVLAGRRTLRVNLTEAQAADHQAPQPTEVELAPGESREVTLQLRPTVPNSVEFRSLSRWFIPEKETCDFSYALDGDGRYANRVDLEITGSGYGELASWNDGLPSFRPLAGVTLFKRNLDAALTREQTTHRHAEWRGESEADRGMLKPPTGGRRHINVAFSPYTLLLRYYRDVADAGAGIELAPFWPQFAVDGAPRTESLRVIYKVVRCTRFAGGKLLIWDKDGAVVHERELVAADATEGDHTLNWDGALRGGGTVAPAGMPYRAQVRLNCRRGEANAVAVAATHTEVRLYVHPETPLPDVDPYDPAADRRSLLLGLAPVFHKATAPVEADGRLWTKYALALAGFHPGPVSDAATNSRFEGALTEFQRSVPKARPGGTGDYARLALTTGGNDDADTRAALAALEAFRRRPWFGNATDRSDLDSSTPAFRDDFRDPAKDLIVWVDDRHWYTDPDWLPDITPSVRTAVTSHPTALGNRRGPYTAGDVRVSHDERDIPRPWIPLQVDFRLLSKDNHLTDVLDGQPDDATLAACRNAIGPLRVDWTFDEIDGTTITVLEIETGLYHKERTRTKSALEWSLNQQKTSQYRRKDVKRRVDYFNCPSSKGGIRPAGAVEYYKAPFGHAAADALLPWKVAADTARESLLTIVHDSIGQPDDQVFAEVRRGRAGIYFRPSRIAGDGYQVRSQVRFQEHPSWRLPNAATLAKRYPRLPQAQTARMRNWRKSSIRGYFGWGVSNNWASTVVDLRRHYKSCHVHLVNENGVADADVAKAVTDLWDPAVAAELQAYRDLVKSIVRSTNGRLRTDANITLATDKMWPWSTLDDLGIHQLTGANPARMGGAVWDLYDTHGSDFWYRLTCRLANEIADRLEKKFGRMRGHVIIEFQCTGKVYGRDYQCTSCGDRFGGCERTDTTTAHSGKRCPSCSRPLSENGWWADYTCANGHSETARERSATSKRRHGRPCGTCSSPLVFQNAYQGTFSWEVHTDFPVPSLGDPVGLSLNFNAGHILWAHELGHNRYLEHAANAPGNNDLQHDSRANPDATVATYPAPSNRWDRACLMTYVSHLANFDPVKDQAFCCFKCVLKNRGWKLAGLANPPGTVKDP